MAKFIQDRVARVPSQNIRSTGGWAQTVLSGDTGLGVTSAQFQKLDGGGANRNVHLPGVAESAGVWFFVSNVGGSHDLVFLEGGVTVISLPSDEDGFLVCDGFNWAAF